MAVERRRLLRRNPAEIGWRRERRSEDLEEIPNLIVALCRSIVGERLVSGCGISGKLLAVMLAGEPEEAGREGWRPRVTPPALGEQVKVGLRN